MSVSVVSLLVASLSNSVKKRTSVQTDFDTSDTIIVYERYLWYRIFDAEHLN